MASNKFPGPSINHLIDDDPMIVKNDPIGNLEMASRASALPKGIKNSMTINHIGKEQGPGGNKNQ